MQLFGQKPPNRGQPPKIGGNVASMGVSEEAAGAAKERRAQALRTGAFVRMPKMPKSQLRCSKTKRAEDRKTP